MLKVLSCIVLSVHKTLILTFFRSKIFLEASEGAFNSDKRRLKETGVYCHKYCKLNKTNMLNFGKDISRYQESLKRAESSVHQWFYVWAILDIHIAVSNLYIDARILV